MERLDTMYDIQERIAQWQRAAFGDGAMDTETRKAKVREEMAEWLESPDADETADVLITLYGYAAARGFDLVRAVEDKFFRAQMKHPAIARTKPTNTDDGMVNFTNTLWNVGAALKLPIQPTNELEARRWSVDDTWFVVAETVAKRGTCPRRQVGAVVVDCNGEIVATGYNGAPRGLPHCTDAGCINDTEDHARCKRSVHAEINALIQSGSYNSRGGTLYVTTFPCIECAQAIINSGIVRVVYGDVYTTQAHFRETVLNLFDAAGVEMVDYYDALDS